ncbi:CopG family transcriptional regulator [Bacillus sp. FJAT-49736]|uniref:CopG family transcriptional regulator n=1 Tax=Bacillus sp. FJAT-49736 TaxID=2833582 RepID=UPI001BC917DE|nr:CopG family transcriptional regulator [Bacillus sp. FJAT-49736]MBS4172787.1 CopG family transcriptional regulator [Bacillus sp. FJAT-49736]
MADTEKITINMNVVDLGKVDFLVEQGFYSNRTDFIKTSIRNQLSTHAKEVETVITSKSYVLGITRYDKRSLTKLLNENKKLNIKVIGMLVFEDDINVELVEKTINSVKVFGVLKARPELKEALFYIG